MAGAVAVTVTLIGAVDVARAASWTTPFDVPLSVAAGAPHVVADARGNATVAWVTEGLGDSQVLAATRPVDGAPVSAVISSADREPAAGVSLAGDLSGRVAAAWITLDAAGEGSPGIDVALGGPGPLGASQAVPAGLLAGGASEVDVAVSAAGDVVLAFTDLAGRMRVLTRRSSDGQFVGAQMFALAGAEASDPEISLSSDGRAVVAWQESREEIDTQGDREISQTTTFIRVSRRVLGDAGRAFEAPVTLATATERVITSGDPDNPDVSVSGGSVLEAQVAIDDDAATAVAFTRTTQIAGGADQTSEVLVAIGSVAAGAGSPAAVSPGGQDAVDPSLDLSSSGTGVLAWTARSAVGSSAHASRRAAGGAFLGAEIVSAAASSPAAAVRPSGLPVVAYVDETRVLAVAGTAGGYEAPVALGLADVLNDEPALAADGRGGALAVWRVGPLPDTEGELTLRAAALQPDAPQPDAPQPEASQPEPPQPDSQPAPATGPPVSTPAQPEPPTGPPADDTAPTIRGLRMVPDIFWVASDRSAVRAARMLPRGSTLRFQLSEGAFVRITISREAQTHVSRSRCDRPSTRRRDRRVKRVGILRDTYSAGIQRVRISGRIGHRALSRGRYVARLRASDRTGNLSSISAVRFTVC